MPYSLKLIEEKLTIRQRFLFGRAVQEVLTFWKTPKGRKKALDEMLKMRDEFDAILSNSK